jgi:hypothetical protein
VHDLCPGRSARLTALAWLLHLGGLIGLLYVTPPLAWPVAASLIGLALWRALSGKPGDVLRAQGQMEGEWMLTRRDGRRQAGWQVEPQRSFCHPWLVILALRNEGERLYLPLAADAVGADALRRLRVSLRAAG